MLLLICALFVTKGLDVSSQVTHETTLMWTLKSTLDGSVDVRGVPGDPEDWVSNGIKRVSNSYFTNPYSRQISRRLALAFQYSTRRVFFSDVGFKEIFRIVLQPVPTTNETYIYEVPIEVVYGGISTAVNGMAMDWASGSLYWTDALYNWITVANASDYNMAKRIVNTGISRPMGLAVYPQKGLMFWSLLGAVPKIERSTLSGQSRENFVDSDVDRPLGLSIDYDNDHLYWVDDLRDTVERVDLDDSTKRWTMHVGYRHSLTGKLFGLAIYNDFIFATDQVYLSIDIFNKSSGSFISNFSASVGDRPGIGIPYDIMMYDSSMQEEIDSDCKRLQCSDICISDGGQKAHCICQEGYSLSPADQRSCVENATFRMPQYLYSVGQSLCGTDVMAADQEFVKTDVRCFYNVSGHEMVALGFNAYAGYLYFSDQKDQLIHRMILSNGVNSSAIEAISANTGNVSGLSVDWIADNLYWTDEGRGVLMVSRVTGRYPKVLFKGLDRPQSLAVNPLNGTLYWATPDSIYIANMDGTNAQILIHMPGSQFDGMVLDIQRDLLYWVDRALPGIRACHMDGSGLEVVLQDVSKSRKTFNDVTVYTNYIAWTDGTNSVYFGVTSPDNSSLTNILRGVQHVNETTSHDIITYDTYLQPPLDPGKTNPCDVDNDPLGCSQLCLLTPSGRQCSCSLGFTPVKNSCVSEPLMDNFLLFIDPYHKAAYQYDIGLTSSGDSRLRGIDLNSANLPSLVAYDHLSETIFWFDEDRLKNSLKEISIFETVHYHTIATLDKGVNVQRLDAVDKSGYLLYTDSSSGSVFLVSVESTDSQRLSIENVYGSAIAADECTGDIYWVDNTTNDINTCNLNRACFYENAYTTIFQSWSKDQILGLSIVRNVEEKMLIVWTANEVYSIGGGNLKLMFVVDGSFSLTGAVRADKTIYFASAFQNAIYQYDIDTASMKVTVDGFSKITDLKIFVSAFCDNRTSEIFVPVIVPVGGPVVEPVVGRDGGLGAGAIAGIVIGSILFLLLLILLSICLAVILIRRRGKQTTTETVAYTNPTYDRLSSISSTLSRMPEGAVGINPYDSYNNNDGEKKDYPLPPSYDELYDVEEAVGGLDSYFYTECEKKVPLPFPEVSAVDLPIFKVEGADSKSPEPYESPAPSFNSDQIPSSHEDVGLPADQDSSSKM